MLWTKHIFGNVCEHMFENMVCLACSLCSGMFACSWHILVRASQIWHWLNICSYVRLNACSLHNSKRHVRNTPYIYGSEDLILSGFLFTLSAGNGGLTGNPSRELGDVVDSKRAHRWASGEPALLAPTLSGRRPPAAKKLVPVRLVELLCGPVLAQG